MAVAFRAANSNNNAGGATSLAVTAPTGTVSGDLLIAVCTANLNGSTANSIVVSAGWTVLDANQLDNGNNSKSTLAYRIADGTATDNVTFSFVVGGPGVSLKASGVVMGFSGASAATPVFGLSKSATSTTAIPSVTITYATANSFSVSLCGGDHGSTITPPTSYTEPANADTASTGGSAASRSTSEASYLSLGASTGSIATGAATFGTAAFNLMWAVAVAPSTTSAVTESLSGSESVAATATVNPSVTESGTASDALSVTVVANPSLAESGTAADTPAAAATVRPSLTESGAASDTPAATANIVASSSESASAVDAVSAAAVLVPSVTEAGSAVDAEESTLIIPASVSETESPSDTVAAAATIEASLEDTGTLVDVEAGTVDANVSVAELATPLDDAEASADMAPSVDESVGIVDSVTAAATLRAFLEEFATVLDDPRAVVIFNGRLVEVGSILDALAADLVPGTIPPAYTGTTAVSPLEVGRVGIIPLYGAREIQSAPVLSGAVAVRSIAGVVECVPRIGGRVTVLPDR